MAEWISANRQLPNEPMRVLTMDGSSWIDISIFDNEKKVFFDIYNGKKEIIFWQPLPSPPAQ